MSQPKLLRQLGLFSATAIVVSNMIGTGVFDRTDFVLQPREVGGEHGGGNADRMHGMRQREPQ